MMPLSTGSMVRRWRMACFMMKHLGARVRHNHCIGMRILTVSTLAAITLAGLLVAQDQMTTLKVDVDVVSILASVRDKRGGLVPNQIGRASCRERGQISTVA